MNLHVINIEGLRLKIRSRQAPPFPCPVPLLTTLSIFMGGAGQGELSTRIIDDVSKEIVSASNSPHRIRFAGAPREIKGVKIFVPNCTFPHQGLYWVELILSGELIARQPIRLDP